MILIYFTQSLKLGKPKQAEQIFQYVGLGEKLLDLDSMSKYIIKKYKKRLISFRVLLFNSVLLTLF